jgi:hypothetical protein
MRSAALAWLAATGIALVLLAAALAGWVRAQPARRRLVGLAATGVAATAALLFVLSQRLAVPIGWVSVLMEGPTVRNVEQLYGSGAHFGPGFQYVGYWLAERPAATLPAVVHANVCLAALNAVLFFFIARAVLPSWWASLAFALVYAGNINTLHADLSETPAPLWAAHFWLGCTAAAIVTDAAHATRRVRWLAYAALLLLAGLATLLRTELLVLAGPAVAVATAMLLHGEGAIRAAARRGVDGLRRLLTGPAWRLLAVGIALMALELVQWPGNEWGWMAAALRPLNLSFLLLPSLLGVVLPFGIVILFVLGMVHTLRRWFTFLLLPVSALLLFKIYASAAHGVFFERMRYLTFLMPAVMFIALFGYRELEDWARRWAWPWWWTRLAILLLLASCTVWQAAGPKEIYRRRQQLPGLDTPSFLLSWNQQTEVRYLLDLVRRYPDCVFLARSAQTVWVGDGRSGYRWLVFGAHVDRYRALPDDGQALEDIAAQAAPGAACVLLYRGLDCNLTRVDACDADSQGRPVVEERTFENLPYNDITEYGAHRPQIRLGVYAVRDAARVRTMAPSRFSP